MSATEGSTETNIAFATTNGKPRASMGGIVPSFQIQIVDGKRGDRTGGPLELVVRGDGPSYVLSASWHEIDFTPTVFGERLWIIEAEKPL